MDYTITLSKENKRYIKKRTLSFSFYTSLFLCLYFMIFAPDPRIIAICSVILFWNVGRKLIFILCVYCNTVDFAPITIQNKKIKNGFGYVRYPGQRGHNPKNRYIYALLPSGLVRREKVNIVRYYYINVGDNGFIVKTLFLNRIFTFKEFVFNEYTDPNTNKTLGAEDYLNSIQK